MRKLDRPNYRLRLSDRGIWQVVWTERRIPRSLSTRTGDEAAARVFLDQFLAGLEAKQAPASPLIGDILDHYLADRKGETRSQGHEWSVKAIRRHVGNLKPEHLDRKLYWKRRAKEGAAAGTIAKEVGHLRAAFATAVKDKLIAEAPRVDRPSSPAGREVWITKEDAAKLRRGAATPHIRLFVALACATGARKGALEDLRWDQVDLEKGIVRLRQEGEVETRKRRPVVPLPPTLVRYLRFHRENAQTPYVIEWRGAAPVSVRKGLEAARQRAGLPDWVSAHILRHSVITWMVEAGIPTAQIARFVGDTEAMIEKVYSHHRPDYLAGAAQALKR